jgi:DNA-binding IclR family transcriptional regulator
VSHHADERPAPGAWTFLTDHAHVLVAIARRPRADAPELAAAVGLGVAEVRAVLGDLQDAGYVRRIRHGDTSYTIIDRGKALRHPVERHHPVGRLLDAVESPADVLRGRLAVPD